MPLPEEYRRFSFLFMGSGLFVGGIILLVVLYTWYMIKPQLPAILWAVCWAAVLAKIKRPFAKKLLYWGEAIPYRAKFGINALIWTIYVVVMRIGYLVLWVDSGIPERTLFVACLVALAILFLFPWLTSSDTLATIVIITALLATISFFSFFVVKTCYEESLIATGLFRSFVGVYVNHLRQITENEDGVEIFWKHALQYCDNVPEHIPVLSLYFKTSPKSYCVDRVADARDRLPDHAQQLGVWAGANVQWFGDQLVTFVKGTMDLLGGVSDAVFSGFIFISLLYYFVKNERLILSELEALSPLEHEEIAKIYTVLDQKVFRTFILSVELAAFRFCVTLFCFWYADFEILWMFSFLSGFLAIVPILSSWLVWLPATILLIARDGVFSGAWPVMVSVHVLAYIADYGLYKLCGIDEQKPEVIGMAFVLGVYAFGAYGVLLGPLVSGALLALLEIYKAYLPKEDNDDVDQERSDAPALDEQDETTKNGFGTMADKFARRLVHQASLYLSPRKMFNRSNSNISPKPSLNRARTTHLSSNRAKKKAAFRNSADSDRTQLIASTPAFPRRLFDEEEEQDDYDDYYMDEQTKTNVDNADNYYTLENDDRNDSKQSLSKRKSIAKEKKLISRKNAKSKKRQARFNTPPTPASPSALTLSDSPPPPLQRKSRLGSHRARADSLDELALTRTAEQVLMRHAAASQSSDAENDALLNTVVNDFENQSEDDEEVWKVVKKR